MAASTAQVLSLYRKLMKESNKFPSYNYRTYALRRVQDAFRANRSVEDPKMVEQLLNQGRDNLDMIRRQVAIGKMYPTQKTIVEG
ncbi:LYR motif-containing protein 4B isoform X1 [Salmo salar]|uniref:LYR motif-containing protein 4B isoform X1 n=1 Tax=Salmo salar TaxID=8030 RepID=A0A1S3NCR0_SALSA|nr:LYR motif-containing protein 4B isoform X1 [Salmo salar]XP_029555875.1 LYR motif-containing protein 4B [Salmo trutta]|eukprot:XP_014013045.1 PREDICTED: LYR motif-containing protein 4B [Salmo salar]